MPTQRSGDYVQTISPQGYVNNREITNLSGIYLVKGSKNCRIVNKEKVATSERYKLLGAGKDINNPIVGSFDWKSNTNVYRNIRTYRGTRAELEVWYEQEWVRFKNGYISAKFEWTPYWIGSELLDVLVGVNGTDKLYMWTGGIAKIVKATTTTITKTGWLRDITFSFDIATRTIVDVNANFLLYDFKPGEQITIEGSNENDGEYTISTVTADTITLIETDVLALSGPDANNIVIRRSQSGTWAQARFLLGITDRAVLIEGVRYTYTGGENTGTLTGLVVDPTANSVTAGDLVFQDIVETEATELAGMSLDLVGVSNNQLYVASNRDRRVFISSTTDYTDFDFTSPLRVPGEGFKLTLDSAPTAIVPDEDDMYISGGDNDWFRVFTELTSDQLGERINIKRLKIAPGQAAPSQGAVAHIKNNIAFLNVEKSFDTLGNIENVETTQNVPLSDDIRNDIENYDITDVHALYFRRSVFIALPREGLVLEYNMRFGHWQPPQELPVRRLAIIDGKLCGHSNNSNETYELFTGYNDAGAPFKCAMHFGYENFGSRFKEKNFDEAATELYATRNTVIQNIINYDYRGAADVRRFEIDGSDEKISFVPAELSGIGKDKLGNDPLGGTLEPLDQLVKLKPIDTTSVLDFFERQRIFEAEGTDIRFEVLAFGENVRTSDNEPIYLKR